MIFLTYGCLVVVVDCWPFTRKSAIIVGGNVCRYPIIIVNAVTTHIRGSYIFTKFRVTESASTRNCRRRENLRYCNFYDNY